MANSGQFKLFIDAIKSGSVELFGRYFKDEYLERENEYKKRRPIHYASENGHTDIVKLLIDHNCDIESSDNWNRRPIHHACEKGHTDIVKLLIDHNCDINTCETWGQRPIHHAYENGHTDIVKLLINQNCDIEASGQRDQRPIHYACENGHTDIVKLLIDHNCNINARDRYDQQPIHYACQEGHTDIVKLLIDHNCDIEYRDQSGESPLTIAVTKGHKEIIEILNGTKLLLACKGGDLENVSSLLNASTIEYCDKDKRRPIHWACESGNIDIIKSLIKTKCDITARDNYNLSPLDIAVNNNNNELVEILETAQLEQQLAKQLQQQLEQQIARMGLDCGQDCDHNLCATSLKNNTFAKGSEIGRGAFGRVYVCKGSGIDTTFAIKYVKLNDIQIDKKYIEGNINDFLPRLDHDRIIKYYGVINTDKHLCLFMEYLPNGSLEDEIRKHKSLATESIIRYSKQILEGLQFLHGNKIIHRDIKPGNILINNENNIKLADFGVGRSLMRTNGLSTKTGTFAGTVNFSAPEVLLTEGKETPYSVSADIWSVGATVINMITGHPPYHDMYQVAVITKIALTKKLELPKQISEEMKSLIEQMLNPDPDHRSTASQLLTLELFSN